MKIRKAVYAGSFDPTTNGHLWMIERAVLLFDELVVAVGINPAKNYAFSLDERIGLLREITSPWDNVTVGSFRNQFLVDYAASINARYILRGVRGQSDLEYELATRHINSDLAPDITTVFLTPPRELSEVSSSMVRGLVGPNGWEEIVKKYVPSVVLKELLRRHNDV